MNGPVFCTYVETFPTGRDVMQVAAQTELHQHAQKYNSQLQEYNSKLQTDLQGVSEQLRLLQVPFSWPALIDRPYLLNQHIRRSVMIKLVGKVEK